MDNNKIEQLLDKYPFLAIVRYSDLEFVCVIQNQDSDVTTIYDFGELRSDSDRVDFLSYADQWWWESNRSIPINIFLKEDWDPFRPYLRTFVNKDLEILHGPVCSLNEIARKKSKRKSITLVRRLD